MTDRDPIFDLFAQPAPALARNTDPDTSHAAAAGSTRMTRAKRERLVLMALRGSPGGLTTQEIADATEQAWNSVTPRMKPLVKRGLVARTDARRKNAGKSGICEGCGRPHATGGYSAVYRITDAGRAWLTNSK